MIRKSRYPFLDWLFWWHRTLRRSLPASLQGLAGPLERRLIVTLKEDGHMTVEMGNETLDMGVIGVSEGVDGSSLPDIAVTGALFEQITGAIRELRLPSSLFVEARVSLPDLPRRDAIAAARWRSRQLSPFPEGDTSISVVPVHKEEKGLQTSVLIASRGEIAKAEQCAGSAIGVDAFDVITSDPGEGVPTGHNFRRQNYLRRCVRLFAIPALAVFFLITAVAGNIFVYEWKIEQAAHEAEATLKAQLEDAGSLMDRVDRVNQAILTVNRLNKRAGEQRGLTFALKDLTQVIGEETYVSELRYTRESFRITGITASASRLVTSLEDSPLFENTQFNAPVVRDPNTGRERFDLSVQRTNRSADALEANADGF